jgi:hypothetical protein
VVGLEFGYKKIPLKILAGLTMGAATLGQLAISSTQTILFVQQHVFIFVEGTTEKVLQFIMPLKPLINKNICFNKKKCIFKHCQKVKAISYLYIYII